MPDPFGMRWFGLFSAGWVVGAMAGIALGGLGWLAWPMIVILTGVGLVAASEGSLIATKWLLGHWLGDPRD